MGLIVRIRDVYMLPRLHPDIVASEVAAGRMAVDVIDPSPGLYGGQPKLGLVTVVYLCTGGRNYLPVRPEDEAWDEQFGYYGCGYGDQPHTHRALYGPRVIAFPDTCMNCRKIKMWCRCQYYRPAGREIVDYDHYSLYAD